MTSSKHASRYLITHSMQNKQCSLCRSRNEHYETKLKNGHVYTRVPIHNVDMMSKTHETSMTTWSKLNIHKFKGRCTLHLSYF